MRFDVVRADDRGTAFVGGDGGGNARAAKIGRAEARERALAGEADQHRPSEGDEHVEPADELEVVLDRLAETDAGIEADAILRDALRHGEREALLEERRDVA